MSKANFLLEPIGFVRSSLRDPKAAPKQGAEGAPSAWLEMHPRDDLNAPVKGVFTTRSADRPNPIGLHPVTLLAIDGLRLQVSPLEAIDGTPVLDLEPSI
jgi:tRNA (Thr-GGU) A37 N-methylase